mmetsp:Transcript_7671/g.16637  ORF Transcript_7671/g.16637 Transcript_7671/m.16637 type:complete len:266 (-) Transcript_7671:164-961(-)
MAWLGLKKTGLPDNKIGKSLRPASNKKNSDKHYNSSTKSRPQHDGVEPLRPRSPSPRRGITPRYTPKKTATYVDSELLRRGSRSPSQYRGNTPKSQNKPKKFNRSRSTPSIKASSNNLRRQEEGIKPAKSFCTYRNKPHSVDDDYDTAIVVCRTWSKNRRSRSQRLRHSVTFNQLTASNTSFQGLRQAKSLDDGLLSAFLSSSGSNIGLFRTESEDTAVTSNTARGIDQRRCSVSITDCGIDNCFSPIQTCGVSINAAFSTCLLI